MCHQPAPVAGIFVFSTPARERGFLFGGCMSAAVTFEGKFLVGLTPEQAFPLFSPRGEEAWVPGWKPQFLYPAGAEWETGLVFRTVHEGQESIWFVRELDLRRHAVTYDRVDIGLVAATVRVACRKAEAESTVVTVRYTFIAISEAGNAFVSARTGDEYAAKMRRWEESISAIAGR
jgi:hypothetical protein